MPPSNLSSRNSAPAAAAMKPLGWLSVVAGTGLCLAMLGIGGYLYTLILHRDDPGAHSRWTGSPEFTRLVFELFGAVFLFGLLAAVAGAYQIRHGRPDRFLAAGLFLLLAVMFYLGYGILSVRPTL